MWIACYLTCLVKIVVILAGDFNVDLMKIDQLHSSNVFFITLMVHQLLPTILRPARITSSTTTLIDNNILYDRPDFLIVMCGIVDHLPILFRTDLRPLRSPFQFLKTSRLINEKTITCFRESLINYDWSEILLLCSYNDLSSAYETCIHNYRML